MLVRYAKATVTKEPFGGSRPTLMKERASKAIKGFARDRIVGPWSEEPLHHAFDVRILDVSETRSDPVVKPRRVALAVRQPVAGFQCGSDVWNSSTREQRKIEKLGIEGALNLI